VEDALLDFITSNREATRKSTSLSTGERI
jgi:hypothetical protein